MNVPDHVKDKAFTAACVIGWCAGVSFFILVFAMTTNTSISTGFALFFGFIFGWAAFNVLINKYINGKKG